MLHCITNYYSIVILYCRFSDISSCTISQDFPINFLPFYLYFCNLFLISTELALPLKFIVTFSFVCNLYAWLIKHINQELYSPCATRFLYQRPYLCVYCSCQITPYISSYVQYILLLSNHTSLLFPFPRKERKVVKVSAVHCSLYVVLWPNLVGKLCINCIEI